MSSDQEEPPTKRQKRDIIKEYVTKIVDSKTNLQLILPDEYTKPIPMRKVFVGSIKDLKSISQVMKILNESLPLKELGHLKRARGKNLIVCPVEFASSWSSLNECMDYHAPGTAELFEFFRQVDVPAVMPKTKEQYMQVFRTWSCNFHPDKNLEDLLNEVPNVDLHRSYMAMAFETLRWFCEKDNLDMAGVLGSANACLVVDPSIDSIVAVSFDNRLNHPVQHTAMIAIDKVARTQDGGSWCVQPDDYQDDLQAYLKECFPNAKFGCKQYFSKRNVNLEAEKCYDGPYLCTNYYIYMVREPCVMCSMALTHARVKRVFFCKPNREMGGLLSRAKLHTVPFLNHRFEVFTGFLEEGESTQEVS